MLALLISVIAAWPQSSSATSDPATVRDWNRRAFAAYEANQTRTAAALFAKAAARGDASARYNLAVMQIRGETRILGRQQALRALRRSADAGFAPAQYMLGELLEGGWLLPRALPEAHQYFEAAARQGHIEAAHALALQFMMGRGVTQNDEAAARWYEVAASAGDVAAQYTLASFYERGTGVPRDHRLAIQWYVAAARQGDEAARAKARVLARDFVGEQNN